MCVTVARELARVVDGEVGRSKILKLFRCRANAPATHTQPRQITPDHRLRMAELTAHAAG